MGGICFCLQITVQTKHAFEYCRWILIIKNPPFAFQTPPRCYPFLLETVPTLGTIRQNAGCQQLTRSGDWLFLNSHKVMGIRCFPGSHRRSRMSASPFPSKMAQWHFRKGGTVGYLSALNGKHKVRCKVRRSFTTWRHSCNFIQRSSIKGSTWRTLLRAGNQTKPASEREATWQKRDSKNFGNRGSWGWISAPVCTYRLCDLMHMPQPLGQWSRPHGMVAGVSDIIYECVAHSERSVQYSYCWSCVAHPKSKVYQKSLWPPFSVCHFF